ncbi:MAG: helix-turn-helix domain-containing protein [Deltaproteobacteria bacterium]|nr:helix-turn-helix domain-containing protein [Deltaproteobacteria bacterium]
MSLARLALSAVRGLTRSRAGLVAENLALRQQVILLKRERPKPRPRWLDRAFWIAAARGWPGWRGSLLAFTPQTVIRWHRAGYRALWRRRSQRTGRPGISPKLGAHITRMAIENPTWGAPRIHAELRKLGFKVSERTVSRRIRELRLYGPTADQQQSWRTFLENHRGDIAAMDLLTVPAATFRTLYVWFALSHGRRKVLHYAVGPRSRERGESL